MGRIAPVGRVAPVGHSYLFIIYYIILVFHTCTFNVAAIHFLKEFEFLVLLIISSNHQDSFGIMNCLLDRTRDCHEWCYIFVNVTGKSESLCLKGFYNHSDNCATTILSRSNVLDLSHIRDIKESANDRNTFGICDVAFEAAGSYAIRHTYSGILATEYVLQRPSEPILQLYDDWLSYRLSKPWF